MGDDVDDFRPCHCLCGKVHPAEPGICQAENGTEHMLVRLGGGAGTLTVLLVPCCLPCHGAAARGPLFRPEDA